MLGKDNLQKFKLSTRLGKKGDLGDFECGMAVKNYWSTGIFLQFRENGRQKRKSSEQQF